ncbi:MAG: ATP-dependent DNA ligase [bacterium]
MLFKILAQYLQQIENVSARLSITEKLAELFKLLSVEEMGMIPYLIQGRIAPAYVGIEFGVAEKSVIKAAALALGRDPKDFARTVSKVGDLGTAIESERAQFQSFDQEDLTITQVFETFVQISSHTGEGSQETKASLIGLLFTKLDSLSCRYIARIPLGQLRLGASDVTIIDALSWMLTGGKSLRPQIERAYQVRPDLSYICQTIKRDGVKALEKVGPVIGTPILMMRAERLSSGAEIIEKLGECVVEPKYDGLRLQIHISQKSKVKSQKSPEVHIFTRGLEDATHMYPDIVKAVIEELDCDEAIIEGEALGYDHENDRFLSFQETIQRKRKHDVEEAALRIPLRLMAFDVLYVDGQSYIAKSLTERRAKLAKLLAKKAKSPTIVMAPETITSDPAVVESLFDTYVTDGLEGIMAKKLADPYKPGAREYSWVKLKKSYSEKVNDTIDCVVMGFDQGKGKRAAFGIGAVLVGIYDSTNERFLTLAKIGTGMTDEEWKQIRAKCKVQSANTMPAEYEVKKEVYPDAWVEPSIVLEIRCDELTESKLHSSGWSMRFPRLEKFRDDKKPTDATSLTEIKKMVKK